MCIADIVIATQSLIRAESLSLHEIERRLIYVSARHVPAWRKPRFVESHRMVGIGNDAIVMVNDEMSGRLADVDAVVVVCSMTHNSFVFLVECVHGGPGEG